MKFASSLAITAMGISSDISSSDTQWWLRRNSLPSFTCSANRMNISGVNQTGIKRSATTERIVEARKATTILRNSFLMNFSITA